jgi:hypothetical protein
MTRDDDALDKYGKRALAPLRSEPPIDPKIAAEEKAKFLLQGENLRQGLVPQTGGVYPGVNRLRLNTLRGKRPMPLLKPFLAALIALFILVGSSFTVYASQNSLPGDPLYVIKSWSEDVRLSMTSAPQAKLNLTLDYTNRRVNEISSLVAGGKVLNDKTSERFQRELENALELAAQMDDTQMKNALGQIKRRAESQGMTIEELINTLPPQAEPAILHLQQRLDEQVKLSTFGENDPNAFRLQIHERLHERQGPKRSSTSDQSESTPAVSSNTAIPNKDDKGKGNGMNQPTEVPGHGNPGNGQGQSTPGNGNHGSNPTHTPEP